MDGSGKTSEFHKSINDAKSLYVFQYTMFRRTLRIDVPLQKGESYVLYVVSDCDSNGTDLFYVGTPQTFQVPVESSVLSVTDFY